jgi:DNA-binding XRE family transcriptional regulator
MDIDFLVTERKRQENPKMSQQDLADQIGVSKTTMCAYESGKQKVSIDVFERWCSELGYQVQVIKKLK